MHLFERRGGQGHLEARDAAPRSKVEGDYGLNGVLTAWRRGKKGSDERMKQCLALVISNQEVAEDHCRLRLQSSDIAVHARAGQFVHVLPRGDDVFDPLLRRAFSILSTQESTFDILFRVQGRGTARLSSYRAGDLLDVLGPLGIPFASPDSKTTHADISAQFGASDLGVEARACRNVILVGGGVGVPPLAMLAGQIKRDRSTSIQPAASDSVAATPNEVFALIGARSRADVLCLDDFEMHGTHVEVATDDGSLGTRGLVTQLLDARLASLDEAGLESRKDARNDMAKQESRSGKNSIVYACGPLPMLRAVAAICAARRVPCQVSLEENMPCGVGVCNGCVVRVARADDEYGFYRRVCVDGPVMWAHEVDWGTA